MDNKEKRFKAALYDTHFDAEKEDWLCYSITYRETLYKLQCSENDAVSSPYEREDFETIADELTHYRASKILKRILDEGIYKLSVYPTTRYDTANKPEGKRIRPLGIYLSY